MPRPLAMDLRERIVAAVEAGSSRRAAAEQSAVSDSCAIKLLQRWERSGSVRPAPMGEKKSALAAHTDRVGAMLATQPDATLDELHAQRRWADRRSRRSGCYGPIYYSVYTPLRAATDGVASWRHYATADRQMS